MISFIVSQLRRNPSAILLNVNVLYPHGSRNSTMIDSGSSYSFSLSINVAAALVPYEQPITVFHIFVDIPVIGNEPNHLSSGTPLDDL